MRRAVTLLILALLSGCAASAVQSPSLAPRPIEARFRAPDAPPAPPPAPVAADATLAARIAALVEQLRSGDAAFAAALPAAERAVAGAGSPQSENWILAQQQVSVIEGARGPSTAALGALDALLLERLDGKDTGGLTELEAAQGEAGRVVEAQNARIDALRARLSG